MEYGDKIKSDSLYSTFRYQLKTQFLPVFLKTSGFFIPFITAFALFRLIMDK